MVEKNGAKGGYVVAGIDVGGTFTDLLLVYGRGSGRVAVATTLTTPHNQAFGVVAALNETGFPRGDLDLDGHATTPPTTALLERRLDRTGIITTRGVRHVIELGRRTRPRPYSMTGSFVPVIPRNLRLE